MAVDVLIVKLGAIGDVIHTLPALAAMRKALPEARISWAVEKRSAEILRGNPIIDDLIEVDTRKIRGRGVIGKVPELAGKCGKSKRTVSILLSIFRGF